MHMGNDLIMDTSMLYSGCAKKEVITLGEDRISELPEPIIHHIFSFLTAKVVAQSSILSKRWKNLWSSVPFLHFDQREFDGDDDSFTHFVGAFLRLRDLSDVHTLLLDLNSFSYLGWNDIVCAWVFHAARHNIRVLQVRICFREEDDVVGFLLPSCIFTCRSLETLSLRLEENADLHFRPSRFIDLVRLKSLHLEELSVDQNLVERILSASPLEDLHLKDCYFETLHISSHTLRRLTIDKCLANSGIQISTPSLIVLKLNPDYWAVTVLQNLPSLVTATINEKYYLYFSPYEQKIDIVTMLSNVESLKIYFPWDKCRSEDFSQIPTFYNVKNLTLGGTGVNVQVVAHFLQRSPNLEKLFIDYREYYNQNTEDAETVRKSRELSFVCNCLKLVEIQFRRTATNEVLHELVKFLVTNVADFTKLVITLTPRAPSS